MAQVTAAAIHGTVTDPSGAVVPDAKVTALNTATGISTETTSNKNGFFTFPPLQIGGPYTVTVSAPGFREFRRDRTDTERERKPRSERHDEGRGAAAQTVQVTATAMQVETANTQLEQDIPHRRSKIFPCWAAMQLA